MRAWSVTVAVGLALFTPAPVFADLRHFEDAALHAIQFVDAQEGWAVGDEGVVWHTIDGGKKWERQPTGILAGAWSRLATFREEKFTSGEVDPLGGRSIRGVAWLDKRALAVGQGGLILTSQSNGVRWGFVNLGLPAEVLQALDFHAIH